MYWDFAGNAYNLVGLGGADQTLKPWYSYQVYVFTRDLTLIIPGG